MEIEVLDAATVTARTPYPALVDALREAFRGGGASPARHHHTVPGDGRDDITLLLMPAWNGAGDFGVKLAAIARSNAARGLPTLNGVYVLFDGQTGIPRAVLDAGALTARRTAAASALAARTLSRPDSRTLFVIGTGRVARELIAAHCAVRPLETVRVWGRNTDHAREACEAASQATGVDCRPVADIERGARGADIVSAAVPSTAPLLEARHLAHGMHIDLVGAFTPAMCEAAPDVIGKADRVFIDTMEGALDEAGDLLQAAAAGVFSFDDVAGDMFEMAAATGPLRGGAQEITLFKSVGTALQDLAAAQLCLQRP
jgi:ornithine cyclodeaminase